jgi:hypothetical protein
MKLTLSDKHGIGVDLTFVESDEIPVPRNEVRLRRLTVTPFADRQRIRVDIGITPFLERPNLEVALLAPGGETVSKVSVVETDTPNLSLTLHLRSEPQSGEYAVRSALSYETDPPQDVQERRFQLPEAEDSDAPSTVGEGE